MTDRKVLAIKLRAMGDTIILTAALTELRRANPSVEIHVLVPRVWADLLKGHPAVDRIWVTDSRPKGLRFLKLVLKLRREKFSSVLAFHASPTTAFLARLLGAKRRAIHFHGHEDVNRFSTVEIPGKGLLKPIIERDFEVLRAIGISPKTGTLPSITLTPQEVSIAKNQMEDLQLRAPVLALGLGASRATKIWPLGRFAQVAQDWVGERNGSVLICVSENESGLAESLLKSIEVRKERVVVQVGLPLRQVAALLSQCQLFLGNDSGLKHLSIAVGLKTITLYGPEHPFEWHPYSKEKHPYFFVENLPCRRDALPGMPPWCGLQDCVIENHQCMRRIETAEVFEECKRQV